MADKRPTAADIDELLSFLPAFSVPGRTFIEKWGGGETTPSGAMQMHYPIYPDDVSAFFRAAMQSCWCDFGYEPSSARRMLDDDAAIASATLDQVVSMITYCVRGERFCDGLWSSLLEKGRVQALLRRLGELRAEL